MLWGLTLRRLEIAEAEARRHIDVWGAGDLLAGTGAVQRKQIEAVLNDPSGVYQRLHRVMDAWAALCSWPVTTHAAPPTREQWLGALTIINGGGYTKGARSRPAPARKPASSAGRYCIRLSRVLTSAVSSAMECLVRLASDRFRCAHTRSTGLSSWA